jgi:hypothetical protein
LTHFQKWELQKPDPAVIEHLATSIFYLSQITEYRLKILVISNKEIVGFDEISRPIESRIDGSLIEVYVAQEEEIRDEEVRVDWLLTWVHKGFMRKDYESTSIKTEDLFLVLEDDALFTESNLNYFLSEKEVLKGIGLIPGFMRSEWSYYDSCWTHLDPTGRITANRQLYDHPSDGEKKIMQLTNPFSASIILDYDLANEYFNSTSSVQKLACYKHPVIYDIGSTATLGLISENIPTGFLNRVAVICNGANKFPTSGSIIRHLGDKYARDKWHRNVKMYDDPLFSDLPTHRTLVDYLRRLSYPDRKVIVKKKLNGAIKSLLSRL